MGRNLLGQSPVRDLQSGLQNNAAVALDEQFEERGIDPADPNRYVRMFIDADKTGTVSDFLINTVKGADDFGAGVIQLALEGAKSLGITGASDELERFNAVQETIRAAVDESSKDSPIAATAGRLTGNILPTLGIPGGVQGTLVKRALTGSASGAAIGGATFTEEGDSRLKNTLVGAALGSGSPVLLSGGGALVRESAKRILSGGHKKALANVVETFEEAGAGTPTMAQGTGSKTLQGAETISSKAPGGGPINKAIADTTARVKARLGVIADDISSTKGAEEAGRVIQKGIAGKGGFVDRFQGKSAKLWTGVDDKIGNETQVQLLRTKEKLTDLLRNDEFGKVLDNPKLSQLKAVLDEAGTTADYATLKSLRQSIGRKIGNNDLVSDIPRAELKQVYKALTQDIKQAAEENSKEALHAFNRANLFTRAGHKRLDDFLERITKKVDLEKVFSAATKGGEGTATINAMKRSLTTEEWDAVVSNVIRKMGKATAGQQNAASTSFSLPKFLTDWDRLGPAKLALFSGSPKLNKYKRDLTAIAKVSEIVKDDLAQLANPSGTGPYLANFAAAVSALTSVASGNYSGAALIGGLVAANNATAHLMTNKKFVNWLASGTKVKQSALPKYLSRLAIIANESSEDDAEAINEYLEVLGTADLDSVKGIAEQGGQPE